MERGTVKWFDVDRGYGFLIRNDGLEVFVHAVGIKGYEEGLTPPLLEGDVVSFECFSRPQGLAARNVVREVQ